MSKPPNLPPIPPFIPPPLPAPNAMLPLVPPPFGALPPPPLLMLPQPTTPVVPLPTPLPSTNHEIQLHPLPAVSTTMKSTIHMTTSPQASSSRHWQVHLVQTEKMSNMENLTVNITIRIRGEEARGIVPDKLYSSHRYVIHTVIQHNVLSGSFCEKYPILIGKCIAVNPENNNEEIVKNSISILKGQSEATITRTDKKKDSNAPVNNNTKLEGQMKIQFTDVSYHHERRLFALRINYFDPSNLEIPVLYVVSPAFRVYARKPSNLSTETLVPDKVKQAIKKPTKTTSVKTPTSTNSLSILLTQKVEELIRLKSNLPSLQEKKQALELVFDKLTSIMDEESLQDLLNNTNFITMRT